VSKIIDYDSTMVNFLRLRLISSIVNPIIESVLISHTHTHTHTHKPIIAFISINLSFIDLFNLDDFYYLE